MGQKGKNQKQHAGENACHVTEISKYLLKNVSGALKALLKVNGMKLRKKQK